MLVTPIASKEEKDASQEVTGAHRSDSRVTEVDPPIEIVYGNELAFEYACIYVTDNSMTMLWFIILKTKKSFKKLKY